MIKTIQQATLVCVACFLLWVAIDRSLGLAMGMDDVELGTHGNIALIIGIVLGLILGIGAVGTFFYLARRQTDEEDA